MPNDEPNGPSATVSSEEKVAFDHAVSLHANMQDYRVQLSTSATIGAATLEACLQLVALTSAAAYRASSRGWAPGEKRAEMRLKGMRYVTLQAREGEEPGGAGALAGFLSYLPTSETDPDSTPSVFPALYIYEVHVHPARQSRALGRSLMDVVERIALTLSMRKTMLTVFTSNERATRFYERLGYEKWDEEVMPRRRVRLRTGTKELRPTYVILAKDVA